MQSWRWDSHTNELLREGTQGEAGGARGKAEAGEEAKQRGGFSGRLATARFHGKHWGINGAALFSHLEARSQAMMFCICQSLAMGRPTVGASQGKVAILQRVVQL